MEVLFRYYLASDDFENLLLRSHESMWHFLVKLPAVPTRPVIASIRSHYISIHIFSYPLSTKDWNLGHQGKCSVLLSVRLSHYYYRKYNVNQSQQIIEEPKLVHYWNSEYYQSHVIPYLLNIGNRGTDSTLANCIERQQNTACQKFSYCLVDKVVAWFLTSSPSHGTNDVWNYLETVLREWEEAFKFVQECCCFQLFFCELYHHCPGGPFTNMV